MLPAPELLGYILLPKGALLVSRIYNDATKVDSSIKVDTQKISS
jgi:hypothetical protein